MNLAEDDIDNDDLADTLLESQTTATALEEVRAGASQSVLALDLARSRGQRTLGPVVN